jgi:hypothetical protein
MHWSFFIPAWAQWLYVAAVALFTVAAWEGCSYAYRNTNVEISWGAK